MVKTRGISMTEQLWRLVRTAATRELRSNASLVAVALRSYLALQHPDLAKQLDKDKA